MPGENLTFIVSSTYYWLSTFKDHTGMKMSQKNYMRLKIKRLWRLKHHYRKKSICRDFIHSIISYLLKMNISERLEKVNFISTLCDGSTKRSVIEQEVVYVTFTNAETFQRCLQFSECIAPKQSQDASDSKDFIKNAFKGHNLETVLHRVVFLWLVNASVNTGKNSGLVY